MLVVSHLKSCSGRRTLCSNHGFLLFLYIRMCLVMTLRCPRNPLASRSGASPGSRRLRMSLKSFQARRRRAQEC